MMHSLTFLICLGLGLQQTVSFRRGFTGRTNVHRMNADISTVKTSSFEVRTTASALDNVKANGAVNSNGGANDVNAIFGLSVDSIGEKTAEVLTSRILQRTDGPVPRSYLPALMTIDQIGSADVDSAAVFAIVEGGMQWYFDTGGRASRIEVSCPESISYVVQSMGFVPSQDSQDSDVLYLRALDVQEGDSRVTLACDAAVFKAHCEARVLETNANKHSLHDIIGRLAHDLGDPQGAIKPYTNALQANSKSAATFRNLGSAYHAIGDVQLAFASYQQAVQLDETDALVYLKLAFFYEDFATKDWIDAAEHSQRCYQYYLDKVDPRDTSILTRLGNLLVKDFKQSEAVQVYAKVLALDDSLDNVWFNKANAQIHIGDFEGAAVSLQRTLALNPSVTAAKHMLRALTPEESKTATSLDENFIREFFDSHAPVYDSHMKKLMYSATRVIRQELATIYRAKFGIFDGRYGADGSVTGLEPRPEGEVEELELVEGVTKVISDKAFAAGVRTAKMSEVTDFKEAQGPVGAGCNTYSSFMNKSLDILDVGCGTGGAGAWLKDYAKHLVGVDISNNMVTLAKKKMIYQDLHVQPLNQYLQSCERTFDLVVASDVLSYLGDLEATFKQVSKVLRPGGHFVFTVEACPPDVEITSKGFRLLTSGRFGYSKEYVDGVVKGLETPYSTPMSRSFSPRLDVGVPVPGYLYIIQKSD